MNIVRLSLDYELKPFNCSDADLKGFLIDDARNFARELLTVTYLLENDEEIIAYYSLINDKISINEIPENFKTSWNKINRRFKNCKRMKSYPAVKIARLAVSDNFKNQGIGHQILDSLKYLFIDNNRTGCRFITVDAYRSALTFYEKNDFKYLIQNDNGDPTRLMFFDLKSIMD